MYKHLIVHKTFLNSARKSEFRLYIFMMDHLFCITILSKGSEI